MYGCLAQYQDMWLRSYFSEMFEHLLSTFELDEANRGSNVLNASVTGAGGSLQEYCMRRQWPGGTLMSRGIVLF